MSIRKSKEETILGSTWYLVPLLLAAYVFTIYLIQPLAAENMGSYVVSLTNVAFTALGAVMFLVVAKRFGWLRVKPGQITIAMSLGLVFWTLAEFTFMDYEIIGESPFPSLADVFYVAGYLMFLIALFMNIRTIKMKFSSAMLAVWVALSATALVLIAYFAVLPIIQAGIDVTTAVALMYPILDLLIVVLVLVILLKFRSGEVAKPWGFLILGFILQAVGDTFFEYAQYTGTYTMAYHPADMILSLGYSMILAGAVFFIRAYRLPGGGSSA
ncbi:MAG: hypothetical protein WED04_05495 [Promethearchaeati archaeon SRVP18_Atabeyarchaeia-1]